jgi:hypothetical protein
MSHANPIIYVVFLIAAFLAGLIGTLAASQAVLSRAPRQKPALERPVELRAPPAAAVATVEC